jgi:Ulp1 family protease
MNVKYIIVPLHIVPAHYVLAVADVQARTMSVFDPFQYSCCIGDRDETDVADLIDKIIVCIPFPSLLVSQSDDC